MTNPPAEDDTTGARGAETLTEILAAASAAGYAETFVARASGDVSCGSCHRQVNPAALSVDHLARLEGASDPDEMMLVASVRCPTCGARGVLTLGYGPNAGEGDAAVLPHLDLSSADSAPPHGGRGGT